MKNFLSKSYKQLVGFSFGFMTLFALELFGWQIEFGVSGDFLSVGAEAMIGVFPDEGFTAKANVGAGLFGAGLVFRVKPAQ